MKIKRGIVSLRSLEETKRFNVFFEELQQIDVEGVEDALLYRLNCDCDFKRMFYNIDVQHAEVNQMEGDDFKIYGFGYAFSDKMVVKIKFIFDVNDFYKNSVEIEKRFEEV